MIALTDPVPQGTRFTYAATVVPSVLRSIELSPADPIIAKTSASLASKWGLQVEQSGYSAALFSSNFDVTLKVLANSAYGRLQDALDVVSGEFYNAGGATVQSARIIDVTAPGAAAPASTGAPGATAQTDQNKPGSPLSSEVLILIGVLIVVAIVVLAIVFSPSTPARVAASFAGAGG